MRTLSTMKVQGTLLSTPTVERIFVLMLIHSDTIHIFISSRLVRAMGTKVTRIAPWCIKLGGGFLARTQEKCRDMAVVIQGMLMPCSLTWMVLTSCLRWNG